MKSPRVLSLLRVSSDGQDVQRQRADMERLKKRFNLEIVGTLELQGVSGTAVLDNAQMQRLLREMQRDDCDGLALSSIDRLFRPRAYKHFAILDAFVESGKRIWSQREGAINPGDDAGFDVCVSAGHRAGSELRELARRIAGGKEEARQRGAHPDGSASVPRGAEYSKATGWSFKEPDASLIQRAYTLLLQGESFHSIAAALGNNWSPTGIRRTLKNRVWRDGVRVYRPNSLRDEALAVRVLPSLVASEVWDAAQVELAKRKTSWKKTKTPPRFLVSGLLRCVKCAKPYYLRCESKQKNTSGRKDQYYCSSHFPGRGPKCGSRSIHRPALDAAVENMLTTALCEVPVVAALLAQAFAGEQTSGDAETNAKEIARLEAKRTRTVDALTDGMISKAECSKRLAAVDGELAALRSLAPTPLSPEINVEDMARHLIRLLARLPKLPFEERRDLLRQAVREISIDSTEPGVTSLIFSGGFLASLLGANLEQRSRQ